MRLEAVELLSLFLSVGGGFRLSLTFRIVALPAVVMIGLRRLL